MKVRIVEQKYFQIIEVKKHWWSRWKQILFTESSHWATRVANEILSNNLKKHDKKNMERIVEQQKVNN